MRTSSRTTGDRPKDWVRHQTAAALSGVGAEAKKANAAEWMRRMEDRSRKIAALAAKTDAFAAALVEVLGTVVRDVDGDDWIWCGRSWEGLISASGDNPRMWDCTSTKSLREQYGPLTYIGVFPHQVPR